MLALPFSIQSFSKLRELNCLYVDKTKYAYDLIIQKQSFFLARPRRFGKSLFISTLEEILKGNKDLFEGLYIDKTDYSWEIHGVISLDFASLDHSNVDSLKKSLSQALILIAKQQKISIDFDFSNPNSTLISLVNALHEKFNRVAILIDEYDHPILQMLYKEHLPDILIVLQSFFAAIKSLDTYIRFLFITGVSAFAKAGVFSGMNHPDNISLDPLFATICGYTEKEIDDYFTSYLKDLAEKTRLSLGKLRLEIKNRYNGYHFGKNVQAVYNPFSLIKAIKKESLQNFWFGSGTPTFLIEEIKKAYTKKAYDVFHLEEFKIGEEEPEYFDATAIPLPALMLQTGYLTIKKFEEGEYILGFPNLEVKTAMQKHLLSIFINLDFVFTSQLSRDLAKALNHEDVEKVVFCLQSLFSHIPARLHIQEERFYHSLLQVAFEACGLKILSEHPFSQGCIDLILELPSLFYVIEVKFNRSAQEALVQIEENKYYEPFLSEEKNIRLLGLDFKKETSKQGKSQFVITFESKRL